MGTTCLSRNSFVFFLFFLLLVSNCLTQGQELWVRNRLFEGHTQGEGSALLVEISPFLKALDIKAIDEGDIILVEGFPIPVEQFGSLRLAPLRDIVDAAGLKYIYSPQLGTIDVQSSSAGTGNRGDWGATKSSNPKRGSVKIGDETFRVTLPQHLNAGVNSRFLLSKTTQNVKSISSTKLSGSGGSSELICRITAANSPPTAALYFNYHQVDDSTLNRIPEKDLEGAFIRGQKRVYSEAFGLPIENETVVSLAGKRFHSFQFSQVEQQGVILRKQFLIHVSHKHKRVFQITLEAEPKDFNKISPRLKAFQRNLRIK